ncbi:cation diffusion facilitator family transporter [uncultured Sharpea sp.]|uniref:cation diffusion facilitator family transporter n=1 Tax=uncultured Sharpea sp. TaxID=1112738 RepID=UPI00258C2E1A|nr:cation diffusion facilitator family transporter [uncultured Sharpea sp.]
MENRNAVIIKTSIIGIATNVLLAIFKAIVGLLANSIAVVLDAINNLSDAMSSIITIVGTKLAGKSPDKKHPLGYGRVEYLSATLISFIVLYAGIASLRESIKAIISSSKPDYSTLTLVIIIVGVVTKIILGRYVKSVGVKMNSASLINSGEDATLDSIISASTLVAAVIYLLFHISLEAYLGAVISIIIIKSAIEMLRDSLSDILGERVAGELSKKVKKVINSFDGIYGSYDLVLNSYGPNRYIGSVHIEVADYMQVDELDELSRKIAKKVYDETGVILTGIGVYAFNTKDNEVAKMRTDITHLVMAHEGVIQVHGFYVNKEEKRIQLDVIFDFSIDRDHLYKHIYKDIEEAYPGYTIVMQLDSDVSD